MLGPTDLKYRVLPSGITLFDSPDVFIRLSSQNSSAGAASGGTAPSRRASRHQHVPVR